MRALIVAAHAAVALATPAWAQSSGQTDDDAFMAFFLILMLVVGFVYVIPTIVAFYRHHPNRWVILLINAVFGATLLGWLGALIWAFHGVHRSEEGSNGGESGLNVFVNDERRLRVVNAEQMAPQPDPVDQLTKLKALLDAKAITQEEHDRMRRTVLAGIA